MIAENRSIEENQKKQAKETCKYINTKHHIMSISIWKTHYFFLISYLADSALCSWKSKVLTCPEGTTALASEVVKDPLPVPDSRTTQLGTTSKYVITKLISIGLSRRFAPKLPCFPSLTLHFLIPTLMLLFYFAHGFKLLHALLPVNSLC